MGLFDRFLTNTTIAPSVDVAASYAPHNLQAAVDGIFYGTQTATREQAMSVPALARARNIICSTVGSLPVETYNHFTKEHVRPSRVLMQPDTRIPGSAIYSWIAEDLLFHGVAYGKVLDSYSESDGARVRAWTRVSPDRITYQLNANQTEILYYRIDGQEAPKFGYGSVIVFNGLDEGIS